MAFGATLAASIDIPTAVATNQDTFVLRFADESKSVYSVSGLTPPIEVTLTIQHDVEKDGTKRSVYRFDYQDDDALGKIDTGSVYLVSRQPINSTFTAALMKQLFYRLANTLAASSAANFDRLLNGEL
jgi:hypothetical protein